MTVRIPTALGLGLVLLFGPLAGMPAADAQERVLIVGDSSPVNTLDPTASLIAQNIGFSRNLFQSLLRYKPNSVELEGDLARSWTVSPSGLVYTFKLRENVKFHKGFGKVTAQDVKFSYDRVMDPKTKSVFKSELDAVKEVRVLDDLTVEIHLKERDVVFLHKCARPRPVAIVPRAAIEKFGSDFARNPIGSGPFVFQSMSREEIVLTANPDYQEGPARIDKIVYKVIPDVDTLVLALERGDVHLGVIVPREKAVMMRLSAAGRTVKFVDRGAWHMMLINPGVKPLDDVRVRRAIAHAIDRDSIITHVLSGTAQKLDSLVPRGYFGHTEEGLRRYDYDPKKAKQLLTEAGYPDGFEIAFDTFTSPSYLPIATVIQNQLEKVGIKAKLSVSDQPTWMKKVTGATAAISLYLPVRPPDADIPLVNFFHSAGFSPGANLARYDKVDKEITAARGETDQAKRRKSYHDIQKKLMEDLPAIPLFMMAYPTPHVKNLAGIPDRDPVWYFDFYHFYFTDKK